ncbi:hypothetical protein JXR93_07710 [bacterium]|nr:hypothetical protein [bacterium]
MKKTIDVNKTITFIETAMNERKDFFDDDDFSWLEKTKELSKQLLETKQQNTSMTAESSALLEEREKIAIETYKIASEIAMFLRVNNKMDQKNLYFKKLIPSELKRSFNKSFEFLKNIVYVINAQGSESGIIDFKTKATELYDSALKCSNEKNEYSSSKLNVKTGIDSLNTKWDEALSVLKLKIKIKSIIHKFDMKYVYKEFFITKKKSSTSTKKEETIKE